jgi:CRP-like cAMP-binding protein
VAVVGVLVVGLVAGCEQTQKNSPQEGEAMKSVDWKSFLQQHPVFSSLSAEEITRLLGGQEAQERTYPQDGVIISAGESGDSLFLIGAGSVQVSRAGVLLSTLSAGDFFGEIAVIERTPRSATVAAKEPCILLEVQGEAFRKLLETHPEIRDKVSAKARERMQQSSQQ